MTQVPGTAVFSRIDERSVWAEKSKLESLGQERVTGKGAANLGAFRVNRSDDATHRCGPDSGGMAADRLLLWEDDSPPHPAILRSIRPRRRDFLA
ncbi:MAG: hypothetical protein AAFP90_14655 [Planctomycetota bacterium]